MPIIGTIASSISGNLTAPYFAAYTAGGTNADYAQAVASDSSGNLYFAGQFNSYCSIISTDKFGVFRWGKTIRPNNTTSSNFSSIRVGADGFVYASGGSSGGASDMAVLVKYNTSGTLQWSATRGGSYASFSDFNFDSSGNIYCVGQITGNTTQGIALAKYNSSGTHLGGFYNTTSLGNCSSNGVCVDSSGNIYIAGRSDDPAVGNGGTGNKALFLKFNSSFTNQFFKSIDNGTTSGRYNACWRAMQIGNTGNIYLTNNQSSTNSGGGLMSFDTSGNFSWARSFTQTSNGGDVYGISNDGTDLYVAGYTAGGNPFIWVKLDTSGTTLLSRKWSTNQNMYGIGVSLPGTAEVALGGFTYLNSTDYRQFFTQVPRDGSRTKSVTLGSQTYTYAAGTATISSYTPSVANVSASWATIGSPTTYSVTETTITPTLTIASI